jgi:hypothetical protein
MCLFWPFWPVSPSPSLATLSRVIELFAHTFAGARRRSSAAATAAATAAAAAAAAANARGTSTAAFGEPVLYPRLRRKLEGLERWLD